MCAFSTLHYLHGYEANMHMYWHTPIATEIIIYIHNRESQEDKQALSIHHIHGPDTCIICMHKKEILRRNS